MNNFAVIIKCFNIRAVFTLMLCLPMLAQASLIRETTLTTETSITSTDLFSGSIIHGSNINGVLPAFSKNFADESSDTLLRYILRAPTGKRFRSTFIDDGSLEFKFESGNSSVTSGSIVNTSPTLTFGNLGGDLPTLIDSALALTGPASGSFTGNMANAIARYDISAGADFWFESFTIEALIPASFTTNLITPSGIGSATGLISNDDDNDYGQFLRLESIPGSAPIPVPATWLLIVFGGLILHFMRRKAS